MDERDDSMIQWLIAHYPNSASNLRKRKPDNHFPWMFVHYDKASLLYHNRK